MAILTLLKCTVLWSWCVFKSWVLLVGFCSLLTLSREVGGFSS